MTSGLGEEGQSLIEFVLTLILFMAFVLFFFQLTMVFSFGNYVHYATFMSARAYLAAGSGDSQKSRSREYIVQMLKKSAGQSGVDKFPSIAKGVGGGDPGGFELDSSQFDPKAGNRDLGWLQGVRYTFKSKLFVIPMGGTGRASGPKNSVNSVTLTSESWLGREPSDMECRDQMKGKFFDNGC